jgi:hypothetical protein
MHAANFIREHNLTFDVQSLSWETVTLIGSPEGGKDGYLQPGVGALWSGKLQLHAQFCVHNSMHDVVPLYNHFVMPLLRSMQYHCFRTQQTRHEIHTVPKPIVVVDVVFFCQNRCDIATSGCASTKMSCSTARRSPNAPPHLPHTLSAEDARIPTRVVRP